MMLQEKLQLLSGQLSSFSLEDYFPSAESLPSIDSVSEEERQKIFFQGLSAVKEGIPPLPANLYMEFRRNGNRHNYETLYYRRRILLGRMLKAGCFGDKTPELLDGIINMLSAICDEWTWVIPAHNWPNDDTGEAFPPIDPPRVDLMAGNTASLLALTIYYLREPLMAEAERLIQRVEYECRRRCIFPFMHNDDHWWMGYINHPEHGELNNWTPWITDNFLHTLILLKPDKKELEAGTARSVEILNHYLDVLPGDGGCDEGAIYWDHAAGSLFGCLDLLEFLSAGSQQLMKDPYLLNAATYISRVHVRDSYFANFADCPGVLEHMPYGLMYRMGEILGDKELKNLAWNLKQLKTVDGGLEEAFSVHRDFRNYLYPMQPAAELTIPRLSSDVFPDTELYLNRTENLFFSCKGGHNAESHNHNDVGQFMVYWKGQPAVIDPGIGEYTRETFNHKRYTIWTMQSGWHNLPLINGVEQKEGREYGSSSFISENRSCRVGIEKAYPESAGIRSWNRTFEISGDTVSLTDSWELKQDDNSLIWHFHCLDKPSISEGSVMIPLEEGKMQLLYPEDLLEASLDYQEIPETDSKMRVWGKDKIWQICLKNRKPYTAAGKIKFIIKGVK